MTHAEDPLCTSGLGLSPHSAVLKLMPYHELKADTTVFIAFSMLEERYPSKSLGDQTHLLREQQSILEALSFRVIMLIFKSKGCCELPLFMAAL